jgi:hypothetical protein
MSGRSERLTTRMQSELMRRSRDQNLRGASSGSRPINDRVEAFDHFRSTAVLPVSERRPLGANQRIVLHGSYLPSGILESEDLYPFSSTFGFFSASALD